MMITEWQVDEAIRSSSSFVHDIALLPAEQR